MGMVPGTRRPRRVMHHFAPFVVFRTKLGTTKRPGAFCKREGHVAAKWVSPLERPFIPPGIIRNVTPQYCVYDGSPVISECETCDNEILCMLQGDDWEAAKFCWSCGEAHAWATREERVRKLYELLESEALNEDQRLIALEQLAVLSEPADQTTHEQQVRAGQRIRDLTPKLWETLRPVLQSLLTAEVKQQLGLP